MRYAVRIQIAPLGTVSDEGVPQPFTWRSVAYAPSAELYVDAVDVDGENGQVYPRAEVCVSTHPLAWMVRASETPGEVQSELLRLAREQGYPRDPILLETLPGSPTEG